MTERTILEAEWLRLTREELPALAASRGWPIRFDHCFQRVLLDAAYDGCWYDHVRERPAYRHAAAEKLSRAVGLARAVADGRADLPELNRQSLRWRGKAA